MQMKEQEVDWYPRSVLPSETFLFVENRLVKKGEHRQEKSRREFWQDELAAGCSAFQKLVVDLHLTGLPVSNKLPGEEHLKIHLFNASLLSSEVGRAVDSAPFVSFIHSFATVLALKEKLWPVLIFPKHIHYCKHFVLPRVHRSTAEALSVHQPIFVKTES